MGISYYWTQGIILLSPLLDNSLFLVQLFHCSRSPLFWSLPMLRVKQWKRGNWCGLGGGLFSDKSIETKCFYLYCSPELWVPAETAGEIVITWSTLRRMSFKSLLLSFFQGTMPSMTPRLSTKSICRNKTYSPPLSGYEIVNDTFRLHCSGRTYLLCINPFLLFRYTRCIAT